MRTATSALPPAPEASTLMAPGGAAATAAAAAAFLASPAVRRLAQSDLGAAGSGDTSADRTRGTQTARALSALAGLDDAAWQQLHDAAAALLVNAYGGSAKAAGSGWLQPRDAGFEAGSCTAAAEEAAAKLTANRAAVVADVISGAGLERAVGDLWGASLSGGVNGRPSVLLPVRCWSLEWCRG